MTKEQMLENIRNNCEIWDRWSYDSNHECFVFFTLHDCYEVRENVTFFRYKAKSWIGADMKTASFILGNLTEDQYRTFTSNINTFEYEEVS